MSCRRVAPPQPGSGPGLNSRDARDAPRIDPQFLSDGRDSAPASQGRANSTAHHRDPDRSTGFCGKDAVCDARSRRIPPNGKRISANAPIPSTTRRGHLQRWGRSGRPDGGSRRRVARPRASSVCTRGRRFDHAGADRRQYQCPHHHDRRESGRSDPSLAHK